MSLDVSLECRHCKAENFSANITHNLGDMADAAGIYDALWRPEEIGITEAHQLIEPLTKGIDAMLSDPAKFKEYNDPNGWGTYDVFVPWVQDYLAACEKHPDAVVSADR